MTCRRLGALGRRLRARVDEHRSALEARSRQRKFRVTYGAVYGLAPMFRTVRERARSAF